MRGALFLSGARHDSPLKQGSVISVLRTAVSTPCVPHSFAEAELANLQKGQDVQPNFLRDGFARNLTAPAAAALPP